MNPPQHPPPPIDEELEVPLTMDNSDDEEELTPPVIDTAATAAQEQPQMRQAMLRQQARMPVGIPSRPAPSISNLSYAMSNPNRSSNPRLDETITVERTNMTHGAAVPEQHVVTAMNAPSSPQLGDDTDRQISTPATWSVVETNGGTPPSARSRKLR